jgi:hypothetical protein
MHRDPAGNPLPHFHLEAFGFRSGAADGNLKMEFLRFFIHQEKAAGFSLTKPGSGNKNMRKQRIQIGIIRIDESVNLNKSIEFVNVNL